MAHVPCFAAVCLASFVAPTFGGRKYLGKGVSQLAPVRNALTTQAALHTKAVPCSALAASGSEKKTCSPGGLGRIGKRTYKYSGTPVLWAVCVSSTF